MLVLFNRQQITTRTLVCFRFALSAISIICSLDLALHATDRSTIKSKASSRPLKSSTTVPCSRTQQNSLNLVRWQRKIERSITILSISLLFPRVQLCAQLTSLTMEVVSRSTLSGTVWDKSNSIWLKTTCRWLTKGNRENQKWRTQKNNYLQDRRLVDVNPSNLVRTTSRWRYWKTMLSHLPLTRTS